ncbi:hypothetical protein FGG08_001135 [Glutinoglossum americanum]|uniref:Glycosyl transferase CAP10 domain-containing protein n=1 Tax=Glutinoglossum americanum TaxID=1670608 RepID=A0A9P8L0K5_9PEZI|nr:hypothetical protein FGG08_001135 [Glutinoglossum americanum]
MVLRPTMAMMRRMAISAGVVIVVGLLYRVYFGRVVVSTTDWPSSLGHHIINDDDDLNPSSPSTSFHPIDLLVLKAQKQFQSLLSKKTSDLRSAAAAYRSRRGRHPPPGFDIWYNFAKKHNSLMIEDFFDQIYHDITPLWALPPSQMRRDIRGQDNNFIRIRNGIATKQGDFWRMQTWRDMIGEIAMYLPDMDIALNVMDEPRLSVKWEDMEEYMRKEGEGRKMATKGDVLSEYSGVIEGEDDATPEEEFDWDRSAPYFPLTRLACPPNSSARLAPLLPTFSAKPTITLQHTLPHTYKGYISNYTLSGSICHQPDLQGLHGALVCPISTRSTSRLFPLLGGSKLMTNSEILIPAPIYWEDDPRYATGDSRGKWGKKAPRVTWRGKASGGRDMADNWKAFHRHRFVAMTNASQIRRVESWAETPLNWVHPSGIYNLSALKAGRLGDWVESFADVTFTGFACPEREGAVCPHTQPYFSIAKTSPLNQQFKSKYLIDIDGNSFSGRYRSFLLSSSLPIKATIFREWHDARLIPWKHFVPMDNRFGDLFGIMEYFLGWDGRKFGSGKTGRRVKGHDEVARNIATEGKEWAKRVMRKEDMLLYTWRVLLEFARVIDDRRERLGYVEDL